MSICRQSDRGTRGVTLVELIVAIALISLLAGVAVPVVRTVIKRERERELRTRLWEMRDAIDRYKDAADRGVFQIKLDSQGYPPDLETLAKGIDVKGKKIRFLRRIPVDPMTKIHRLGFAVDAGQSGFDLVGWTKRLRRLFEINRYRS